MRTSFRLGRIAGIEVGAHWSLLVIAAVLVWSLAVGVLPEIDPGHAPVAYWLVALGAIVLFYAALVAHEFGHSMVARRHGVEVERITLWLFGGVAQLGSESATPGDELRIAAAGPAVSFGLGIGFGVIAVVVVAVGGDSLLATGFVWLAQVNILLALFNLLPAFPLDGGRVLRAWLWRRGGDRIAATTTAAGVAVVCAYGLIGLGFAAALFGLGLSGVWFVLLGWFLLGAARAEAEGVVRQELLARVTVGEIMSADPVTVPASTSVADLIDRYVLGSRYSAFPVVDERGAPVGLVTLERVRRVPAASWPTTTVGEAAHPLTEVPQTRRSEPVIDLLPRLAAPAPGRALVLDGTRLVGIVSTTDVTRALTTRRLGRRLPARPAG